MKKILVFVFAVVLLSISCEKIKDCPDCIKNKVKEFAKNRACTDGTASVGVYIFQDQNVYVFSDGTCGADMGATVYTEKCVYLGFLGGFAGNLKINGVVFHDNAIFQKEIWHD
jgi:hypothetical protein